jgi:hypothetical protein
MSMNPISPSAPADAFHVIGSFGSNPGLSLGLARARARALALEAADLADATSLLVVVVARAAPARAATDADDACMANILVRARGGFVCERARSSRLGECGEDARLESTRYPQSRNLQHLSDHSCAVRDAFFGSTGPDAKSGRCS